MSFLWPIRKYKNFEINNDIIKNSLSFIEEELVALKLDKKLIMRAVLLAEELLPELIEHAHTDKPIQILVRKLLGDISITIRSYGEAFNPLSNTNKYSEEDEYTEEAVRSIILKSYGDNLKITHHNGMNQIRILADQSSQKMLIRTAYALVFGILFGLLLKFILPSSISVGIQTYLLTPIKTIFMNSLQIVIGPVIFFSIVSSFSQFKNLSELGRIGAKVMGIYFFTTIIAVLLSIASFSILQPGTVGFALKLPQLEAVAIQSEATSLSLLDTFISIVPSNFLNPFLTANTLQIIFLAILCGIALGMIGEYASTLKDFFEACNSLFLTITTLISRFIPIVVVVSVSELILSLNLSSLLSVLSFGITVILTLFLMIGIYCLLILTISHLNPLTFLKKNREGMLTSMALSSSSAAMPTNLRTCTDYLGISPKVANFSIPLGATVNMDGTCIFLTIVSLFLARAFNVDISSAQLVSLAITIILLSFGAPGVPGSAYVCTFVLLNQLHIPVEATSLIVAIYPFIDMVATMSNTSGDIAASLIVAKSENLLDIERFNQ
ncbi:MAG: dicarboxylate/amino acid:cation symporter [Solobacterium sp.]|nr:dicarboxylate/amino acid:cation symporter [Solobacterium sp.]